MPTVDPNDWRIASGQERWCRGLIFKWAQWAPTPQVGALAAKLRLPIIAPWRELPAAGGLMSYGTNVQEMFRRAADMADRIVKGARPGDMPIEQPTKFDLVINLKTARALGLTLPSSLLARADQVIQ